MPTMPTARPSAPPSIDNTTLSVSSSRMMRPRPAPMAARIASLTPADARPDEQQVGHIRACDQQDEGDRPQQHPERRPDIAHHDFLHRLNAEAGLRAHGIGIGAAKFAGSELQVRVGGRERDARLEAAGAR